MDKFLDAVSKLIAGALMLLLGAAGILVAGSIGALAGGYIQQSQTGTNPPMLGITAGALVATSPLLYMWVVVPLRNRRRAQLAEQDARERARIQSIQEANNRRRQLADGIVSNARLAIDRFEAMPGHLRTADAWTLRAVECYQDKAFSPFWSAVESAYSSLADYRRAVDTINECATTHPDKVAALAAAGGDPTAIAEFPVALDLDRVNRTLEQATTQLGRMVYQAQKHPTFAQIWEQRRTTAAVIAGFANLESAVNNMGSALIASVHSLGDSLTRSSGRVESTLKGMSAGLSTVQQEQAYAMQELSRKAGNIRSELYHQNWGHYPLLG